MYNKELLKDTIQAFKSTVGYIQYGAPPLSLKLTKQYLGEVPTHFIVPQFAFNKKNGIFIGEFETIIEYNMKHNNIKTTLICSEDNIDAISDYLNETIIGGSTDKKIFSREFHNSFDQTGMPNFRNESFIIQKYIKKTVPIENIEQIVDFKVFNPTDKTVELERGCILKRIDENNIEIHCNQQLAHQIDINQVEETIKQATENYLDTFFSQIQEKYENFEVPDFGLTGLYSPYTPDLQSGFFFWVNSRIVLVDPPIYTNRYLQAIQIPDQLIDWVILTHCHTENDIGVLQRFVESQRMEIITTPLIISSFIRKYSKISGIDSEIMRRLFKFKPVVIGAGIVLNGCIVRFHYAFHQIPTLGFEITNQSKSIYYSGHTYFDSKFFFQMCKQKEIQQKRYEFLANIKFIHNIVLFDGGNTFSSTPIKILDSLPSEVKKNTYLVSIDQDQRKCIQLLTEPDQHQKYTNRSNQNDQQPQNLHVLGNGLQSKLFLEIKKHKVMEYISKLEILSSIDVFEGLSIKNIRDLMDISSEEHFNKGQVIIKQNTKGSKWYIILKGKVLVKNQFFEGHFYDGEYFGETALGEDNSGLRMADCIAETDVTLLTLEKQDFWFAFGQGTESMGKKILEKQARLGIARKLKAREDVLANSFFKGYLNNTQMTQFQMILRLEQAEKNQLIWQTGDFANFSILLKSGTLKFTNSEDKNVGQFEKGTFIGEITALIEDTELVTTLKSGNSEVVYWKIYREDLLSFLRRNPGLFLAFGDSKYFK